MTFFAGPLSKWVLITYFSSLKASICPALCRGLNLKDNLPNFGSICLILYNFSGFYKIIREIKDFIPKYFMQILLLVFFDVKDTNQKKAR